MALDQVVGDGSEKLRLGRPTTNAASVAFRSSLYETEVVAPWSDIDADALRTAVPWRTFRWYRGQKHYSGTYWAATEKDYVVYKSRLELARLLLADFDTSVRGIVAQPFLLKSTLSGRE
ncbi:hypothetical protein [Saccharopolyspora sp. NPDC002376]